MEKLHFWLDSLSPLLWGRFSFILLFKNAKGCSMPHQLLKGGKWYCDDCKTFSDETYQVVHEHEMLTHRLPKEYWEWNRLLTKKK
jgi:hypothetical protein